MAVDGSIHPSISNARDEILHWRTQVIGLSVVETKQSSALRGCDKGPIRVRLKQASSLSLRKKCLTSKES
jgi:hypothetical protein